MNKFADQVTHDENNNEEVDGGANCIKTGQYIERHLELGEENGFVIIPNGGSGDCMFKAVSQAVFHGDESRHKEIRKKIVDFIISKRWEKFSEFIEVQHINGNNLLQRQWAKDPKQTYKMYMSLSGTLGSSSELTAAAELYRYNFATVQEYCNSDVRTYRVENCMLFDQGNPDFHYFYFTGDFDNGHWEYIRKLSRVKTEDGTYHGRHRTMIEGEDITIEAWLQRETDNNNATDQLKILTNRPLFAKRRSSHPFEMMNCFRFEKDGTVKIKGVPYVIENVDYTDLFSVLAHEILQNQGSAHETELVLIKHRYSYFEDINSKLITQPWSHNFTTEAIRYSSFPCKGNIQDLICAADLYSFSFVLFVKLEDTNEEAGEEVHQCKFTHVDRWGGENDRILHFFMRLVPAGVNEALIAKWWLLTPQTEPKSSSQRRKSRSRHRLMDSETSVSDPSRKVSSAHLYGADSCGSAPPQHNLRPTTGRSISRSGTPRPTSSISTPHFGYHDKRSDQDSEPETPHGPQRKESVHFAEPDAPSSGCMSASGEDVLEAKESLKKDFESLFGSADANVTSSVSNIQGTRLVKQKMLTDKFKPATKRDLAKHPQKVRTVVKVRDKSNSGRETFFRGSGYMKADDVLSELKSQGLIKLPTALQNKPASKLRSKHEFSFDKIFIASEKQQETNEYKDENGNKVQGEKSADTDISFENESWTQEVFTDEQGEEHAISKKASGGQQRFPQAVSSYLNQEQLNVKRNKVSPKTSDWREEMRRGGIGQDVSSHRPCLNSLRLLVVRFSASIQKLSKMIKRGLNRRYDRYRRSSSLFSFPSATRENNSHQYKGF